ncbi:thiamine biosynthesis protein ThiF [Skermanella stibiiresistens SB22]|uniref:Molybdopterin-synthase adenylyltransferase n=1 Tax=Skermanella stibiiresistens SB22 TaxID=1385369 RepID=W9GTR7_9PROT|nr:molybdopterin-synthase adenylyltransferase MoeB [Skermanella stibiiresistens]EWY37285.1 thiamine biosynthesis protein ThiF [Skermanella stibiiresistens SB22]
MDFTEAQIERYARHIILPEVGGIGQEALLKSRVLVVGAGGLGSPLLLYLAAAGVGTIGVVDNDVVDLSNLQRQIIHDTASIGTPKVQSAEARLKAINPEIRLDIHQVRLDASNVMGLIADHDVIADGTDNFAARYLLADACHLGGRTLVSAAMLRFDGQISTFKSHLGGGNPCYRCIFREPPPAGLIPSCAEGGVLGALAGAVGSIQAIEVMKEILGIGESLSGHLLMYDALRTSFHKVRVQPDPECPLCGAHPTITDLSAHGGEAS